MNYDNYDVWLNVVFSRLGWPSDQSSPSSLPEETWQDIPHDPSQKDMEAAANQSTLPFLQWSKPKEMIADWFVIQTFKGLKVYC